MAQAVEAILRNEDDADFVVADLHYVSPNSRLNRRFVSPGLDINTGIFEWHQAKIRNAGARQSERRSSVVEEEQHAEPQADLL